MSKVVSLRLRDDQVERLERAARRLGRPPSAVAVLLLEESLRQRDFPFVEFRDSPVGRQAYIKGTRIAVWQVEWLARHYDRDIAGIAEHLDLPAIQVASALHYSEAYPGEIEPAIQDNIRTGEELCRLIPNLEMVEVDADSA
jgi:uncharacterized protein (DUF433 family)